MREKSAKTWGTIRDFALNSATRIQDDDDGPKYDASTSIHDEEVVVEDDVEAGVSVDDMPWAPI